MGRYLGQEGSFATREGDNICRFIQQYWKEFGYAPSIRIIGKAFGMKSSETALNAIRELERQGRITRETASHRTIRVVAGFDHKTCEHDWRVRDTTERETKDLVVMCLLCQRVTSLPYEPDPQNPTTWLRLMPKPE